MGQTLVDVVCINAQALLDHHWPGMGIQARARKTGLGKGTIERIQNGEANLELRVVQQLAERCGLQPWQLLVPNLVPEAPPLLADLAEEGLKLIQRVKSALDEGPSRRPDPPLRNQQSPPPAVRKKKPRKDDAS